MIWVITHPVYIVKFEFFKHHHSRESFKTVEFHKLVNFLVEDLLVFVAARQKVLWKNLSNELCQEISNLDIRWITFLKELLEDLSSRGRICCLFKQFKLASLPIWRQRSILLQIKAVIKWFLVLNNCLYKPVNILSKWSSDSDETKLLIEDFGGQVFDRDVLRVQEMLSEETIVSVLMCAVEKTVAVYELVTRLLWLVQLIHICSAC